MDDKENRRERDAWIAAGVTLLFAAGTIATLLCTSMSVDIKDLANASTPEITMATEPEEETFIEPELLCDQGEPEATAKDAPAPAFKGDPKPDIKENTRKVELGKNPKPAPPVEKQVSTNKESNVKTTTPSITEEERQKVTSTVAKGFEGKNGANAGNSSATGSGGTGMGISGVASGRSFKGCPKPKVELRHKTVVTVAVSINAEGAVISAKAKGGAPANIRAACERAAMAARWSAKPDAPETRGTITFTITPR